MVSSSAYVHLYQLDRTASTDVDLVREIATLANEVYAVAEAGMWLPGTPRTDPEDISAAIASGEMLAARIDGRLVGVVRSGSDDGMRWLGMLAVHADSRGQGIGRQLIDAAEEQAKQSGAFEMQLEVLTPADGSNASKVELDRWYRRLGYVYLRDEDLAEHHPTLGTLLATPCDLRVYRKVLSAAGSTAGGARR